MLHRVRRPGDCGAEPRRAAVAARLRLPHRRRYRADAGSTTRRSPMCRSARRGGPTICSLAIPDADYVLETAYDLSALTPDGDGPAGAARRRPGGARSRGCASIRRRSAPAPATGSTTCAPPPRSCAAASIDRGVTMYITPGSREVYAQGGARRAARSVRRRRARPCWRPGCTTCWGYEGVLCDGEVSISTHQMNYHGRNGSRTSRSYLASPYVVAASAVAGKIVDPRALLAERRVKSRHDDAHPRSGVEVRRQHQRR